MGTTGHGEEHFLSASEAAERIGIPHRQISRLVNTGAIDIVGRLGKQEQIIFREEAIDAYIEAHR